jgi:hypothetical protein
LTDVVSRLYHCGMNLPRGTLPEALPPRIQTALSQNPYPRDQHNHLPFWDGTGGFRPGVNGVLEQLFDLALVEDGGAKQVVNVPGFIAYSETHCHVPADADELYRRRLPGLRISRKTRTNRVVEAM